MRQRNPQRSTREVSGRSATAIVMDPKTGKILAMASVPEFDPNKYREVEDYSVFMNPAVSATYEPGSIMKPITMAMGIEEGKVSPNTEYVDTGVFMRVVIPFTILKIKSMGVVP
jgi:cell division protein FtsI/penicillin-binding protein 2